MNIYTVITFLYIAISALHLHVFGPFYAEDCLAPVIAGALIIHRPSPRHPIFLPLLMLMAITAIHFLQGGENAYNIAVLIYLAGLYLFVRSHSLSAKIMLTCGGTLLSLFILGWIGDAVASAVFHVRDTGLVFLGDDVAQTDNLSFLARRYAFLFGNPNILGSFYVLPMLLFLRGLEEKAHYFNWKKWLLLLAFLAFSLLPLVSTFSKHAIMTGAVILAFFANVLSERFPRLVRSFWLPILLVGLVCETTVLFVTFPVKSTPPFINTTTGMYAIHQTIYAKMPFTSPSAWLIGSSPARIHQLYPKLADVNTIRHTLSQYNALQNLEMFSTFVDPHNEYLNLTAFYGIPALAVIIAFFIIFALRHRHSRYVTFFLLAFAFACLWDDLLSKRWLCLTFAFLPTTTTQAPKDYHVPSNKQLV
ncbi:MAG: hypothetical protein IKP58_00930 [Victivallales bacterium]|nr:hypothetical protein [Victivallales bacterium]